MDFPQIISEHKKKYPMMEAQDFGKLAYQSEFGPKHLGIVYENVIKGFEKEWVSEEIVNDECQTEYIGNGYYRCHFWRNAKQYEKELLAKVFVLTAQDADGSLKGLKQRLEQAQESQIPGMKKWMEDYEKAGYPVVSHSDIYRETYHPHYRLVRKKYVDWFPILFQIAKLLDEKEHVIISIDGDCGSGKTTYTELINQVFDANVFHMDDYYLPMAMRDENWRQIPAGNMDLSRFRQEVLEPARQGDDINYRPFNCQKKAYEDVSLIEAKKLTVIEGSYSQHPDLADYYDLKIFLTCDREIQIGRLMKREGDYYPMFESCWMPLERMYHEKYQIRDKANLVVDTGKM